MKSPVIVTIIGAPVACQGGIKDTWREVADWTTGQLQRRFGEAVEVRYYDLFSPDCPPIPPGVQLPLVFVGREVLSSGGKISVPAIRRQLEDSGVRPFRRS